MARVTVVSITWLGQAFLGQLGGMTRGADAEAELGGQQPIGGTSSFAVHEPPRDGLRMLDTTDKW
jgi:hypothetical protein